VGSLISLLGTLLLLGAVVIGVFLAYILGVKVKGNSVKNNYAAHADEQ
jgi:hypothetical protein